MPCLHEYKLIFDSKVAGDVIINIPLHDFSSKLHILLHLHNGSLYLNRYDIKSVSSVSNC